MADRKLQSGTSLGDVLRQRGVTVGEGALPSPPSPAPPKEPALDFGGATKVVLRRERKGHGGKTVTVIDGLRLPPSALEKIARELKRALGCGATVEDGRIAAHGDLAARIEPWLLARGARRVVVGN